MRRCDAGGRQADAPRRYDRAAVLSYRNRNHRVGAIARSSKPSGDPDVLAVAGDIADRETAERGGNAGYCLKLDEIRLSCDGNGGALPLPLAGLARGDLAPQAGEVNEPAPMPI